MREERDPFSVSVHVCVPMRTCVCSCPIRYGAVPCYLHVVAARSAAVRQCVKVVNPASSTSVYIHTTGVHIVCRDVD